MREVQESGRLFATGSRLPVLYSFRRCPYAMRARLAIAVSGTVCELREVVLRDKPSALLEASPKATVPVLVDVDGRTLEQSLDIMLWALHRNDPAGWLRPGQGDLAAMLALIADCDATFKYHLDRYKYPQRYENPDSTGHREKAGLWLCQLNARLEKAAFLFGDHAALADMAILPFVRQYAHTDIAWFDAQPWAALRQCLQNWMRSDLFERVMQKYPAWTEQAGAERFPPC